MKHLLSCPFCGGAADVRDYGAYHWNGQEYRCYSAEVECCQCGATIHVPNPSNEYVNKTEMHDFAIDAWNRREGRTVNNKYIVSLSGGKDSTAMLHKMLEHGDKIEAVIFVDTGLEFPEMYDHLEQVQRNTGLAITTVGLYDPFEYMMCHRLIKHGKRAGCFGYGWPRPNARWCTTYKTQAFAKEARKHSGIECVGIAADEHRPLKINKRYPLIEYGMSERDCLEYCYSLGYDWSGLYEHLPRVSCYCCPLQSLNELQYIYKNRPELWQHMKRLDASCYNSFRIDASLDDLETRFDNASDIHMLDGDGSNE